MRDPLTDPQPGDRVRASGKTRVVTDVTKKSIYYTVDRGKDVVSVAQSLGQWRSWCRRNKAVEVKE